MPHCLREHGRKAGYCHRLENLAINLCNLSHLPGKSNSNQGHKEYVSLVSLL